MASARVGNSLPENVFECYGRALRRHQSEARVSRADVRNQPDRVRAHQGAPALVSVLNRL